MLCYVLGDADSHSGIALRNTLHCVYGHVLHEISHHTNVSNLLELQWFFLPDEFPFIPWYVLKRVFDKLQHFPFSFIAKGTRLYSCLGLRKPKVSVVA